ncbi:hypothetical protein [Carnobacterium sp. TMP28]|uniref:hypothetical protein n=1 Tax=Carnobacterium sp. TMP28 TaxID=3397060 RepID=UPI0039E035C7
MIFLFTISLGKVTNNKIYQSTANTRVFAADKIDEKTKKAKLIHITVDNFLQSFINQDNSLSNEEGYQKYRESVAIYVSKDILSGILPTQEELEGMDTDYIVDSADKYIYDYESSKELTERKIYIDYETLDRKTVNATAYVTSLQNYSGMETELRFRYYFELEEKKGKWIVTYLTYEQLS